jgi:hypothetical protein
VTVDAGGALGATAGFSTTGAAGRTDSAGGVGTATGGAGGAEGAAGAAGFGAGGATAGFAATGGAAGFGGGATAASFFCVIARNTSPGREMCDKSILVLISSSPRSVRAVRADDVCASEPRMWARTFSASCSSSELECVFFSVTPTSGSASRIALLLTSSSLARSLIRTLLIRPFCFSVLC